MDYDILFEFFNDFEVCLLQVQDGMLIVVQFFDGLLILMVFVLLDKVIGEDGVWDESILLLVLISESGELMFVVFIVLECVGLWYEQLLQFVYVMLIVVYVLLVGIGDGVGLVLNLGLDVGMEMIFDVVVQLKQCVVVIIRGMVY